MTAILRRLLDDLTAIARIPAPTFSEEARIRWLEQRLAASPGRCRRDDAGNLVWSWGRGRPGLLVTAHVDTVFPAETTLAIRRQEGFLVGPGVGDNAAAIAVTINVVEGLLQASALLVPGAVAFTRGEEGLGNLHGALAACASLEPEAVIALEGHGLERVIVDAVGSVRARISVEGPGGHPWVDRGTPSALHALLRIGVALSSRRACGSVNVGVVSGGRSINAIADRAELLVEARATSERRLDSFVAALEKIDAGPSLQATVEILGRRPSGRLRRDSQLLRAVRAVRRSLALPDVLDAGSTDANAALALGIPALALGVAQGTGMHTPAERISVDSLRLGCLQLERLLLHLLKKPPEQREIGKVATLAGREDA
jgi:tripeptide aminopeptidase